MPSATLDVLTFLLGIPVLYMLWKYCKSMNAVIAFFVVLLITYGAGHSLWDLVTSGHQKGSWLMKTPGFIVELMLVFTILFPRWYAGSTKMDVL